jgi:LacI family transcriptional regulator
MPTIGTGGAVEGSEHRPGSQQEHGGRRYATIRDVADLAHVSTATVSRVVNGHPNVRHPVREAVLAAIRELGFTPNESAAGLRRGRHRTIGLVVHNLLNPYVAQGARVLIERAASRGYRVAVHDADLKPETEARLMAQLAGRVEGLIWLPVANDASCLEPLGATPVVAVTSHAELTRHVARTDESSAIAAAVSELVDIGHRRFAVMGWGGFPAPVRGQLVQRALDHYGLTAIQGARIDMPAAECTASVAALVREGGATAIFVDGHPGVPAVLLGIREAGATVPEDVTVVAFGDSDWAQAMSPPLSVIAVDNRRVAEEAMDHLLALIEGRPEGERPVVVEAQYIRRGSCAPIRLAR